MTVTYDHESLRAAFVEEEQNARNSNVIWRFMSDRQRLFCLIGQKYWSSNTPNTNNSLDDLTVLANNTPIVRGVTSDNREVSGNETTPYSQTAFWRPSNNYLAQSLHAIIGSGVVWVFSSHEPARWVFGIFLLVAFIKEFLIDISSFEGDNIRFVTGLSILLLRCLCWSTRA